MSGDPAAAPCYEIRCSELGQWWFDCPCGHTHWHGKPNAPNKAEHRVAHCRNRQDIHPNGYYIYYKAPNNL